MNRWHAVAAAHKVHADLAIDLASVRVKGDRLALNRVAERKEQGLPLALLLDDQHEVHATLGPLLIELGLLLMVVEADVEEIKNRIASGHVALIIVGAALRLFSCAAKAVHEGETAAVPLVRLLDDVTSPQPQYASTLRIGALRGEKRLDALRGAVKQARQLAAEGAAAAAATSDGKRAPEPSTTPPNDEPVEMMDERYTKVTPGVQEYVDACEAFGSTPSTRLLAVAGQDTISMRYAGLNGNAAMPLAAWVRATRTCTHLDLMQNRFGFDGVDALADALITNPSIMLVDLGGNGASDDKALPPPALLRLLRSTSLSLTALDFSSNNLRDHGCAAIGKAIAEGVAGGDQVRRLGTLALGGNQAGALGAKALAECLMLPDCGLTTLNLSWSVLQGSSSELIGALSSNTRLHTLDISWCGVEEAGAVQIGTILRTNATLTSLDVRRNRIETYGALAVADGLANNSTLTKLDLSFNPLGQLGVTTLLARGTRPGRTLGLESVAASIRPAPIRSTLDEQRPGGHYKIDLARPYDRWLVNRCVAITGKPEDGSPRTHKRRMIGVFLEGERLKDTSPRPPVIESWKRRGELNFDINAVPAEGEGRKALVPVDLELGQAHTRALVEKLRQRISERPEDACLRVTLSGRAWHLNRDANGPPLPPRGVFRCMYALCSVDALPEPLDGAAFSLSLQLPWEWWTACVLLDLARNNQGRWMKPCIDKVAIDPKRLPRKLPHSGLLSFTFAAAAKRTAASEQQKEQALEIVRLELALPAHRAVAMELEALPRGPRAGGMIAVHLNGSDVPALRVPSPLPKHGHLRIEVVPPFAAPDETAAMDAEAFATIHPLARQGGWVESGLTELLSAASAQRPFSGAQALALLESVLKQATIGAKGAGSDAAAAQACLAGGAPPATPMPPTTPRLKHRAAPIRPRERPRSATAAPASAPLARSSTPPAGGPSVRSNSRPMQRPQTAPPKVHRPAPPRVTGGQGLELYAQDLMASALRVLSPCVVLSERAAFLVNVWRWLVQASEPRDARPVYVVPVEHPVLHDIAAKLIEAEPSAWSPTSSASSISPPTSPTTPPTTARTRLLDEPNSAWARGTRHLRLGDYFAATTRPKPTLAPPAEPFVRAKGASKMPMPPSPPRTPNP